MSVFKGQQIALDLGISLNFKKKSELRKAIVDNGGTISYIVTKKCHCVVTSDPEKCDVSSKCRMALKYGLPVLNLDYIWDCLAAQKLLSFDAFVVGGKATSLDFKSGIISAGKAGVHAKDKKKKRIAPFNPSSVQVWKDNDPAQPVCDEKELEAAKYAMFTWFNTAANCEESYVVELHAPSQAKSQDSNRQEESDHEPDPLPYRIFFQSASSCGAVKTGQKSYHESRYTARADQALDVYAMLVNSVARKPGAQVCRSPIRGLGSTLLQKRLAEVVAVHEGCSEEVRDLVEHVWREAVSEVTAILGKISAIKLDQVEKADAILSKVSSALQSSQSDSDIEKLAREFYDTLNVKEKRVQADLETKISWKKWLVKKRDLCQLVKDIVCVSEMTNFENQAVVEAKYAALRCRITALSGAAREEVEQLVLTNIEDGQELKVLNVYEIWRQVEDVDFRRDLEPKRLLFHSSRVENFVGILSRGLLLPKVVVDEYGGTRSDAGMLGSGIYFASASSTSVRYSAPSNTKGSRLMLINEVALGKTKDLLEYDTSLTSPPDGYDSTHGVANSDNKDSQFKVHEYVVYKTNQQRIRYLVEFATSEDVPQPLSIPPQDDSYVTSEPTETKNDVSLHDVLDVADPIDKLRPGLVGSGDQEVELKGVHIRAKLIDLAGEVVVLQEYYNNSSEPIEAKYVFPLGEAAAVCGFEAFINGKHVVGEVKEKEKAHKEYKKAISEGHGAYLMDQDEETPDVFTVSVGNLPAGACVLIKITYVTELRVEDEKISFRLPGTVAPWKEKAALEQTTQTDLRSHKTKATRTSVQVAVEMPFDIRTLHCPTHKVKVKQTASKAYVELARHQEFGSGFLLLIGLAEIHVPRMWVEKHPSKPHHQACMLTFYPEFELEEVTEGEIILVLDMSNSMKGTQILKLALLVLQNIPHGFKFNVIRFGSDFEELFPAPKLGTEETAEQARKFIAASSVTMGSTDVRSALRQFYLLPSGDPSSPDLPRNVFLLSDGHLVEESLVLEEAARHSGHTRVFTFGVSSTCNSHTLRALSRVSAGAFEYFDPKTKSKWQPKVKSQISKAMQPGLTSVCVEWQQFDDNLPPPSQAPRQITALFNGSQQIVYGFVPNCTMATLKAVIGGQEVSTVVSTSELSITEGQLVHRLTAKAIIQDWEAGVLDRDRTNHELSKMELKDYVIELSKEYSIVTQLTSFVAVEKREENEKETLPKGPTMQELLNKESVENLPYMGWTSLPEPSLESLIEELSFIDEDKIQDSHQEKVEKTALLEKFYQDQCGKSGPCSLETLQTATVLADSYRHLGERDKADTITVQSFKDASPMLRDLTECDNYPAVAECLADLRRNLSQDIRASQNTRMFIPWPKQGNVSIKVRNLTNALMEFGITQATSVKQLKDMIYARDGLPQDTQRLILNGRQLEDDCRLSDLGADLEDQFYLVQRLRGGGDAPTRYELFSAAKQEESDDDDNEVLGGGLFSDGSYDSTDSESDLCEEEDHSKGEKGASLYESCYAETHFSADEYCCDVEVFKAQATSEEEEEEEMGFGLFDDISDAVQPQSAKVQEKYDDLLEVNLLSDMDCDESKTLSMLEKGDMELNTKKKKKKSKKKPVDSDWAEEDMDDFVGPSRSGRVGRGGFRSTFIAGPPQQVMRSSAPSIGQSLPGTSATPHGLSSFFAPTQQQQQKRFEPAPFSGSSLELTSGAANQPMSAAFGGVTPQPKMVAFRRSAPQPTFGSNIRPSGQEPTFGSGFGESAPQQSLGFGGSAPQQSFGFGESAAQQSFGFGGSAPQQSLGFGGSAPQQSFGFGGSAAQQSFGFGESAPQQSFGFGGSAPQQSLGFGGSAPQQSLGFGGSAPQQSFGFGGSAAQQSFGFGGSAPQQSLGFGGSAPQQSLGFGGSAPQQSLGSGFGESSKVLTPPRHFGGLGLPVFAKPPPPPQMQASSGLFASAPPPPPPPQMQASSGLFASVPPPPPPQMQATSDLCYCAPPPPNVASTSRATSATRSSAPPPPPPPAATPPPPPTPRERPPPPTPRERPPPPTPRERPPPPQAVTGCLTPPPALKQKLARLRSSVQAAPFVLAKAKPAPERQKGRSPLPAPPPQREEMKADAVLVPLMHFQNKNYDGDLGSESRSGLDIQRSSPTSLAYSPTSPAYSPTSQALVVADRSSLRGRVTGGKSKEPLSERLIKFSESPVIKELKEKQSEASKKVHGSVIWREIRPQASAVSVESRERSESRSRKASPRSSRDRERSRERAEDGVCLLSLSVAESCADFDTEEEEVQKVKAKYAVMKSRKFSARKRTSEKATNVIEAAVPQKKFWHEAPYGIGTDLSPARVRHRVQLSAENVTKLLQLQNIRGWWQFGPELDKVLGVNSEQCIGVLCKSGLSSLGLKAQDEIQHVLATVLVLFILLNKLLPQFLESDADLVWADILDYLRGLSRDDAWELLEQSFEGSCEHDVARSIIEALDFLTQVDQKYPALYSRLELGTNWFNVAVNLMGRAVVAAA